MLLNKNGRTEHSSRGGIFIGSISYNGVIDYGDLETSYDNVRGSIEN